VYSNISKCGRPSMNRLDPTGILNPTGMLYPTGILNPTGILDPTGMLGKRILQVAISGSLTCF